ncbi:MAG: hypothetical protein ACE5GX_20480 [Thermoanaerobaculia bacterium]
MVPTWLRFLLAALAVWRITHLLIREDGPWKLVARLRGWFEGGFWGGLLGCFKCLSVWVAIPFAFFVSGDWVERAVAWLALSGLAILLEEQLTGPLLIEEGESDELLRRGNDDVRSETEDAAGNELERGPRSLFG